MSIKRLLLTAGLLAIGACGTGPNGICTVDQGTEGPVCTYEPGTPGGGSLPVYNLPEGPEGSVQR
jgi:hypothetical protein